MIYICNAFSLSMLADWRLRPSEEESPEGSLVLVPVETAIRVETLIDPGYWLATHEQDHGMAVSAVGHADTAAVFSTLLCRPVAPARVTLKLSDEDLLLVGQYVGPRLPEGSTTLPPGAPVRWLAVNIVE